MIMTGVMLAIFVVPFGLAIGKLITSAAQGVDLARANLKAVAGVEAEGDALFVRLGTKHTACLAEDKCGIAPAGGKSISFKPLPPLPKAKCCG